MSKPLSVAIGKLQICSQNLVVFSNAFETIANAAIVTGTNGQSPLYATSKELSEDIRFFVVESTELS